MPRQSQETQLALIIQAQDIIQSDIKDIKDTLKEDYVPVSQFNALKDRVDLLQRGFIFLISITAIAVLGAIFRLIFRS